MTDNLHFSFACLDAKVILNYEKRVKQIRDLTRGTV